MMMKRCEIVELRGTKVDSDGTTIWSAILIFVSGI